MPTMNDANGTPARINDKGFSLNVCVSLPFMAHAADNGDAYSIIYNSDPNVAGDFFYMKNSSDKNLRIYKIKGLAITTGGIITLKTGVTGTPTTGIDLTPVNSLIGNGKLAEGVFNRNTSAASMALTGGNTYDILQLPSTITEKVWDYPAEIALEKNQTFVMANSTDPTSVMTWVVYFYYHDKVE